MNDGPMTDPQPFGPQPFGPQPFGPLVDAAWLLAHAGATDVKVLDLRFRMPADSRTGAQDHADIHIPGAAHLDIDAIKATGTDLPHMLPDAATFAAALGRLGVRRNDRVVVYDDAGGAMAAARGWWMLRTFDHPRVAMLNGGLAAWRAAGGAIETGPVTPSPVEYGVPGWQSWRVADRQAVLATLDRGDVVVIDARPPGRWAGTAPEPWPVQRPGRIPGSRNIPALDLIDPDRKTVLPPDAVLAKVAAQRPNPEAPIISSCGSGVTACVLALAMASAGRDEVTVYDGSFAEWGRHGPIDSDS